MLRGWDFQQLWLLAGAEAETLKICQDGQNPICLCWGDLWHPNLIKNSALPQNGHWKPELLRGRDFQQLWFLAGAEAKTSEIHQDGRNQMFLCWGDLWHPNLIKKSALPQNGCWKPELLRGQDCQQLWFLVDVEAETSEIHQDGRNQMFLCWVDL